MQKNKLDFTYLSSCYCTTEGIPSTYYIGEEKWGKKEVKKKKENEEHKPRMS